MRDTPRTGRTRGSRRQAALLTAVGLVVLGGTALATAQVEDSFHASALHDELSIATGASRLGVSTVNFGHHVAERELRPL